MNSDAQRLMRHHRLLLESRENAHLFAFLREFGAEAEELVRKTNYEHGLRWGERALARFRPASRDAKTAVEMLVRTVVGGLPTEEQLDWQVATERKVVIKTTGCEHLAAWNDAGVPTDKACDLYKAWVDGFIHAINPHIRHYKNARVSAGDPCCEEVWELEAEGSGDR